MIGNTLGDQVEKLVEAEEREGQVETMKSEAFITNFLVNIFDAGDLFPMLLLLQPFSPLL